MVNTYRRANAICLISFQKAKGNYMNKPLFFILLVIIPVLMCSCHNQASPTSLNNTTSTPQTSAKEFVLESRDDISPTKLDLSFESIPKSDNMYLMQYGDDKYLVVVNNVDNDLYYEYDAKTKSSKLLAKTPPSTLGSGDFVITENNILYTADAYGEESNSSLIKVDISNKTFENIVTFNGWPPFQYLRLVDDSTLLIFRPKMIESGETLKYSYHIERLSLDNKTKETLIEINDSTKQFISTYDYANGHIYAYQGEVNATITSYYIQTYDINGSPIKRYNVSSLLNCFTSEEHILNMYVYKDYFLFFTNMSNFYLFQTDSNNVLQKIELPDAYTHSYKYYRHPKRPNDFGCLYDGYTNYLYRYDNAKQCFVKQKIILEDNKSVYDIKEKEDGSVLITLYDYSVADQKKTHYSIPALNQ